MNKIYLMFCTSYDKYGFDKIYYVLFWKTSGIIHVTPLLLVPFTEYPSSPSLCIYVGNKQEVGYAEMCVLQDVLDACLCRQSEDFIS